MAYGFSCLTLLRTFPNTRLKPDSITEREKAIPFKQKKLEVDKLKEEGLLTCSAFNVSSIKICCNFSLTKLIQNCSKPFFWKKKKWLACNYFCKTILKSFLGDIIKSLNRKVSGIRRKQHSFYLGEINLEKVQEGLTKAKMSVVGFLLLLLLLPRIIPFKPDEQYHPPQLLIIQKRSYLEYFKAIDIQHTNVVFFVFLLHRFVDGLGERPAW